MFSSFLWLVSSEIWFTASGGSSPPSAVDRWFPLRQLVPGQSDVLSLRWFFPFVSWFLPRQVATPSPGGSCSVRRSFPSLRWFFPFPQVVSTFARWFLLRNIFLPLPQVVLPPPSGGSSCVSSTFDRWFPIARWSLLCQRFIPCLQVALTIESPAGEARSRVSEGDIITSDIIATLIIRQQVR